MKQRASIVLVEAHRLERALDLMHVSRDERTAARGLFHRLIRRRAVTLGEARRQAVKVVETARTQVPDATPKES